MKKRQTTLKDMLRIRKQSVLYNQGLDLTEYLAQKSLQTVDIGNKGDITSPKSVSEFFLAEQN